MLHVSQFQSAQQRALMQMEDGFFYTIGQKNCAALSELFACEIGKEMCTMVPVSRNAYAISESYCPLRS